MRHDVRTGAIKQELQRGGEETAGCRRGDEQKRELSLARQHEETRYHRHDDDEGGIVAKRCEVEHRCPQRRFPRRIALCCVPEAREDRYVEGLGVALHHLCAEIEDDQQSEGSQRERQQDDQFRSPSGVRACLADHARLRTRTWNDPGSMTGRPPEAAGAPNFAVGR